MSEASDRQPSPLEPEKLTWAVLLSQWVEFAQRAVGLPRDGAGQRMRESVPDVIMLQAVWFALGEINELDHDERALGLDRAQVLIERHAEALRARWQGVEMPAEMARLIADAEGRLHGLRGGDEPG